MDEKLQELQNQLNDVSAEKIALDQTYVESLKTIINLRKHIILQGQILESLSGQVSNLKGEKDSLVNKIQELETLKNQECLKTEENENVTVCQ